MEGEEGAELFSTLCDESVVVLVPADLAWSDMAWRVEWSFRQKLGEPKLCSHQFFSTLSPFLQSLPFPSMNPGT